MTVLCACGWLGQLPTTRTPCPHCGANDSSRLTPKRVAILRMIAAGQQPRVPGTQRRWFTARGLIAVGEAPPPSVGRHAKYPARTLTLTAAGLLIVERAEGVAL